MTRSPVRPPSTLVVAVSSLALFGASLGAWPGGPVASAFAQTAPASPTAPPVDDPMLAPLPAAPSQVASWAEARRQLVARSPDLRLAEAGLLRAEGQWRQALSALLPSANLSLGVSYEILDDRASRVTSTPGAEATNPRGTGRLAAGIALVDVAAWRGRDAASAGREGAEANLRDALRRLDEQLAGALIAVLAAERVAVLNRDGLRLALERQALAQRAFQLGAATELDVVRIQQDVAVARAAVIAGDEQVHLAREALAFALGTTGEVGVPAGLAKDLPTALVGQCRPLRQGEARDDVVAARARVTAAERRQAQARAAYFPTLDLFTTVDALTEDPGPGSIVSWNVGVMLSVPIWDGGQRRGALAEQAAAAAEAQAQADAASRAAQQDGSRARRAVDAAHRLVDAAREARDLALRVDEMTRKAFLLGRATSVDLLQSAAALRQAELTLVQREFEWSRAQVGAILTEAQCDR